MDLLESLAKEHSKRQCDRIVNYIGSDKERFAALMHLFFKGEYRITQRAAWPVSYCVRQHPHLIRPWFKPLLDQLAKSDRHIAVIRNTLRLLQDVPIPQKYHGRVMSICFDFIQSPDTAIAVKAFSLTVLEHLAADYPDILPELRLIIEEQWDQATPAFRSRAKKILKKLGAG
ncbi:MAG TPA: hypothetical protein VK563_15060 [Puia sp.]|nr:hypothetical protein [Puia sp.]